MQQLAALLVLPRDSKRIQDTRHDAQADERHADGVPLGVEGRVGLDKRVRRNDAADVAEACPRLLAPIPLL
jgi:hypothetical protein